MPFALQMLSNKLISKICSDTRTLVLIGADFWCHINGIPWLCWNRGSDSWVMLEWKWVKKSLIKWLRREKTGKSTAVHTVALYYSKKQILLSSRDGYLLCSCIRALQKPFCRFVYSQKSFYFLLQRALFFFFYIVTAVEHNDAAAWIHFVLQSPFGGFRTQQL